MGMSPHNYYSVYNRRTDQPVIIHGMARECIAATGLTSSTFYTYVTHTRQNSKKKRKYDIFVDEEDDEDGE